MFTDHKPGESPFVHVARAGAGAAATTAAAAADGDDDDNENDNGNDNGDVGEKGPGYWGVYFP